MRMRENLTYKLFVFQCINCYFSQLSRDAPPIIEVLKQLGWKESYGAFVSKVQGDEKRKAAIVKAQLVGDMVKRSDFNPLNNQSGENLACKIYGIFSALRRSVQTGGCREEKKVDAGRPR